MDEFNADGASKTGKRASCRICDRERLQMKDELIRERAARNAGVDCSKEKRCSKCDAVKLLTAFYVDPRHSTGRQSQCKACMIGAITNHERRNPAKFLLQRARARARKKGYDFALTLADILPLPTHCPVFGTAFSTISHENPAAYSLDRLDNSKGYVPGNVAVISYLANRLKNNGTAAQLTRIAEWMRSIGLE